MTEIILHNFFYLGSSPGNADGIAPLTPPVLDAAGNIYGTTSRGNASNKGTIFEISLRAPSPAP